MQLLEAGTQRVVGTISDAQFQTLVDELEEESPEDTDYYIDSATVDMLDEDGADPALVAVLRGALAGRDGIEITWKRV
jgi:processive 1,2-diacylglycerol beta-glucosyltransferase